MARSQVLNRRRRSNSYIEDDFGSGDEASRDESESVVEGFSPNAAS